MFGTNAKKPEDAQATGMPLFFSKPVAINAERHAKAAIRTTLTAEFSRNTNSVPITMAEFVQVAKHYPIGFTNDDSVMPMAIVGLEQVNEFVTAKGVWPAASYVPAYVRKYPFIFSEDPESDQLTLCVDEGAAHFVAKATPAKGVEMIYGDDGKPTEFTQKALEFCSAFHQEYLATREFCAKLKELGLLMPQTSEADLPGKGKIRLGGFQGIDQDKFNALSDEAILELNRKGYLAPIYFCLQSISSWHHLLQAAANNGVKK